MSDIASEAPVQGPTEILYDHLAVHRLDLARKPANGWNIIVTKEESNPMAENSGAPAGASIGGAMGVESMLRQILSLLVKYQPGFNALAVTKERESQGFGSVTFARGANFQAKGEIVVTKQVGRLSPAEIAGLGELAAPLLRGMEEIEIPFKSGAGIDPPKQTGDVLAVTKEHGTKLADLGVALGKVLANFEGEQSIPARLGAMEAHLRVTKSQQGSGEPPPREPAAPTEIDYERDPEGAMRASGLEEFLPGEEN